MFGLPTKLPSTLFITIAFEELFVTAKSNFISNSSPTFLNLKFFGFTDSNQPNVDIFRIQLMLLHLLHLTKFSYSLYAKIQYYKLLFGINLIWYFDFLELID